jgi:hypothetical protein
LQSLVADQQKAFAGLQEALDDHSKGLDDYPKEISTLQND